MPARDSEPVDAESRTRLIGIAPQLLVDDIERSVEYYCGRLGFELDFRYEGFYASVEMAVRFT